MNLLSRVSLLKTPKHVLAYFFWAWVAQVVNRIWTLHKIIVYTSSHTNKSFSVWILTLLKPITWHIFCFALFLYSFTKYLLDKTQNIGSCFRLFDINLFLHLNEEKIESTPKMRPERICILCSNWIVDWKWKYTKATVFPI